MLLNKQPNIIKQSPSSFPSPTNKQQIYIMIRSPLQKYYNIKQWKQICSLNFQSFQQIQHKIFNTLTNNQQLFDKYFALFYQNHIKIYHWYLLARQKHHEIKLYIYKQLLRKTLQEYQQQHYHKILKQKQMEKQIKQKQKQHNKDSIFSINQINNRKYKIDDLTHQIFNFMANKTKTASLLTWHKPYSLNNNNNSNSVHQNKNSLSKSKRQNQNQQKELQELQKNNKQNTLTNQLIKQQQNRQSMVNTNDKLKQISNTQQKQNTNNTNNNNNNNKWRIKTSWIKNKQDLLRRIDNKSIFSHDFHDLYLQTFHACDGPRYIFYNYQKHMKGQSQKDKYNMFIRGDSKIKAIDMRLSQNFDQQNLINQIRNCQINRKNTTYQYSSFGNAMDDSFMKKTSKIVFRRMRSKNIGKFIRK